MEYHLLDASINSAVADLIVFKGGILVASYDRMVRFYEHKTLKKSAIFDSVINKLAIFEDYILACSLNGQLYLLDSDLNTINSFDVLPSVSFLSVSSNGEILISSWSKTLAFAKINFKTQDLNSKSDENSFVSQENINQDENESNTESEKSNLKNIEIDFKISKILQLKKQVTAINHCNNRIAVAFEDIVKVYDSNFQPIFSYDLSSVANCVCLVENGIFMGLLNGKIRFEHFLDADESFLFNVHFKSFEDEKVFHSVNQIIFDKYLYSAGSDGKVYKWDIDKRTLSAVLFSAEIAVKKILFHKNHIYAILENLEDSQSQSICVYKKM